MMKKSEPADLPAVEARRLIASGALTSEALMRSCLDRIAQREPDVQAFELAHHEWLADLRWKPTVVRCRSSCSRSQRRRHSSWQDGHH